LLRTPPPLISSPSPFTNMALPGSGSSSFSSSSGGNGNNSPEWHYHHNNSPPALYGLASNLIPSFFQASQKPLGSGSASGSGSGSGNGSLLSLLSGKFGGRYNSHNHLGSHHSSSMNTLSNSISNLSLSPKDSSASSSSARAADKAKKDAETAVIATLASQTLLKRLGGAFWDAFSGHTTPGASTAATIASGSGGPSSSSSVKTVDQEKVRKVLEGRAVVKVADVEPASQSPPQPASRAPADCGALLEESFKSLTLGK
jgi:bZIP-type transcription factor MBZ1